MAKAKLISISGVKNSGKTTLIDKLLPKLTELGYKVATIKHDGHGFNAYVEGTDTYKHMQSGAYGTVVFSKEKFMVVKKQENINEKDLIEFFPEADIIILEGFKGSDYPKIEIVRKGNSTESVCKEETLIAIATDIEGLEGKNVVDLNDIDLILKNILDYINNCDE